MQEFIYQISRAALEAAAFYFPGDVEMFSRARYIRFGQMKREQRESRINRNPKRITLKSKKK